VIQIDRRLLWNFDWTLLALTLGILAVGWGTLAGLSPHGVWGGLPLRQLAWIALGLIALVVVVSVDYRVWVSRAIPLYGLGIVLLGLVLVWGRSAQGARRRPSCTSSSGKARPSESRAGTRLGLNLSQRPSTRPSRSSRWGTWTASGAWTSS